MPKLESNQGKYESDHRRAQRAFGAFGAYGAYGNKQKTDEPYARQYIYKC